MVDLIEVRDLTRSFGRSVPAVEGLTFSVPRGEIFALLGPNGAGKTTTVRLLSALIHPSRGEVRIRGILSTDGDRIQELRDSIGILPEVPGLYEGLSAFRNLQFFGRLHGLSDATIAERAKDLLRLFDLWERRDDKVATLSKGMKQKVAIARALLHDPECLILDEPISGLDPEAAKAVRDFLIEERRRGRTIVVSTHNLDDADRLSDRVAVMRSKLIALGSPRELKARLFRQSVEIQLLEARSNPIESLSGVASIVRSQWDPPRLTLELRSAETDLPEIVAQLVGAGYRVQFVRAIEASLEEAYLALVEKNRPAAVEIP
ncbi:MAG: ABC transporter ATP-binding protein [Thermoplasmata archaeon]